MSRYHGITTNTYKRFVIDAGAVYRGFVSPTNLGDLITATRGGNTFTIETEYREMLVDGAKGPVVGSRRITRVSTKLTANFVEWTTDLLLSLLPGSSESLVSTHDMITRSLALASTDYLSNIAIVGEISDASATGPCILVCNNALCTSNFEAAFTDGEETVVSATWEGHFPTTDLDTEPWEIYWAHDSNPTTTTAGP